MYPALRLCGDLFEAADLGAVAEVVSRIQPGLDLKLNVGREIFAESTRSGGGNGRGIYRLVGS